MRHGNRSILGKIVSSPFTLVIALILFGFLARALWNLHGKAVLSATQLAQAQAELSRLEAERNDISQKVSYLSTEQGIEAELRTKYRAVKMGESVAVIIDPETSTTSIASSTPVSMNWWQKLLQFLGL